MLHDSTVHSAANMIDCLSYCLQLYAVTGPKGMLHPTVCVGNGNGNGDDNDNGMCAAGGWCETR